YFAEANVQFGIEIDVATWEESPPTSSPAAGWTPGPAALTVPLPILTDIIEVQVFDSSEGPRLAGAVELVSPANKDRPGHRMAFLSKFPAYLQQVVVLIGVEVLT